MFLICQSGTLSCKITSFTPGIFMQSWMILIMKSVGGKFSRTTQLDPETCSHFGWFAMQDWKLKIDPWDSEWSMRIIIVYVRKNRVWIICSSSAERWKQFGITFWCGCKLNVHQAYRVKSWSGSWIRVKLCGVRGVSLSVS